MAITESILNYRRFLKRRNYSPHTVKNYLNTLKHFVLWLNVPVEEVVNKHILHYIDFLMRKRLKPKTIIATWLASGDSMSISIMRKIYGYPIRLRGATY